MRKKAQPKKIIKKKPIPPKRVLFSPAEIASTVEHQSEFNLLYPLHPTTDDEIVQEFLADIKSWLATEKASKEQVLKLKRLFLERELAFAILDTLRKNRAMTRSQAASEEKYLLSNLKLKLSRATITSAMNPMPPRSRPADETKKLQTLYILIASAAHRQRKYSVDRLSFEKSDSWYVSIGQQASVKLNREVSAAQVKKLFTDAQQHVRKSVI